MFINVKRKLRIMKEKRAIRTKIKRDEWMLQNHPYLYTSCITEEDKKAMKELYMYYEYVYAIDKRKYSVHTGVHEGIAFSGRYKGQAYYRKQWKNNQK